MKKRKVALKLFKRGIINEYEYFTIIMPKKIRKALKEINTLIEKFPCEEQSIEETPIEGLYHPERAL
jgi:hypothetical protein